MPIIELPSASAPLSQGDILEGIDLYATANSADSDGGTAKRFSSTKCLVLSRPCNLAHKPNVVVAAVDKYADNIPKEIDSFGELLDFLNEMRDGEFAPDVFYLGHLPDRDGRFCCRFDALFSIEIPKDYAERQAFATKRRIATLNADFLRDLHLRLFRAFASLGFDDHRWMSDPDLSLLVSRGKSDILEAQKKSQDAETAMLAKEAKGEVVGSKQRDGKKKLQENLANLEATVRPYEEELSRRKSLHNEQLQKVSLAQVAGSHPESDA
jgi:hypothetical protein